MSIKETVQGMGEESLSATLQPISTTGRPLGMCILVDYRISSRFRLRNFIAATQLFEQVEEPGSLHECLSIVAKQSVDTFVFGPSVRSDKIREFLRRVTDANTATECAFIQTRSYSAEESIDGLHSVVEFPCSQMDFNVGVVSALSRAHDGNLPEVKRHHPESGRPIPLKEHIAGLEFPDGQTADNVIRESRPSVWPRETFDCVLRNLQTLRERLEHLQPFNLRFRSDGSPTEFTSEVVLGLIDSVFPPSKTVPGLASFKGVLEELIYSWAQIGTELGRRTADRCLKREIINCFGLSIQ
jgi:hypothetical protein